MVYFMGNYMYMYIQGWNIMLESIIEANLTTANDLFVTYDIAGSLHSHLNVNLCPCLKHNVIIFIN